MSTISFSSMTITSSSGYSFSNTPGASMTVTSWFSAASITDVIRTDSVAAVREETSNFFYMFLFFRLSAMARPFIFPHILFLFFSNIINCIAPRFCFLEIHLPFTRCKTTLSCICCIYDFVGFIPSLLKHFRPSFRVTCIKICTRRLVYWSLVPYLNLYHRVSY